MTTAIRALALMAAFLLANCSSLEPGGPNGSDSARMLHVLRFAVAQDVTTLNPMFSQHLVLRDLSSLTMAWLVKWDGKNRPYAELVTRLPSTNNGDISADGRTITYHLRSGVRWSDGAPFTADDVAFTVRAIQNPANNIVEDEPFGSIDRIKVIDAHTIVLHLKRPYSIFVEQFFSSAEGACILPKHLLARYRSITDVPYNALPIGIGPFKYERWDRSSRVVLVRNPTYWRGQPKLDQIVFAIYPDLNSILTVVQTHGADLWFNVPGSYFDEAKRVSGYHTIVQPALAYRHVDFNLSNPALANATVRRALLLGAPREVIAKKVLRGLVVLQDEAAPKFASYYDRAIGFTPQNIDRANALLEEAGWRRGPDGVRTRNGQQLDFIFAIASGSSTADQELELLRQSWQQIGVTIRVKHYADALLFGDPKAGGIFYNGKFDIIMFNWPIGVIGDYSSLYSCAAIIPNGQNGMHWCNAKADSAMAKFFRDYDESQRASDDAVVLEQLAKDAPTMVMSGLMDTWVVSDSLRNFNPNQETPFDNFLETDIRRT